MSRLAEISNRIKTSHTDAQLDKRAAEIRVFTGSLDLGDPSFIFLPDDEVSQIARHVWHIAAQPQAQSPISNSIVLALAGLLQETRRLHSVNPTTAEITRKNMMRAAHAIQKRAGDDLALRSRMIDIVEAYDTNPWAPFFSGRFAFPFIKAAFRSRPTPQG